MLSTLVQKHCTRTEQDCLFLRSRITSVCCLYNSQSLVRLLQIWRINLDTGAFQYGDSSIESRMTLLQQYVEQNPAVTSAGDSSAVSIWVGLVWCAVSTGGEKGKEKAQIFWPRRVEWWISSTICSWNGENQPVDPPLMSMYLFWCTTNKN